MTVKPPGKNYDSVGAMMAFEDGSMKDHHELLRLFSYLIKTGMAWTLQGSYGRAAKALIDQGAIARNGDILQDPNDSTKENLA